MLGSRLSLSVAFALAAVVKAGTVTYTWSVDWVTASPAGVPRQVIGINGAWPCPEIQATKGDTIVVHLTNNLGNQTTGLHFHGINQVSTNWMDGPSMATQCPIAPGKALTYQFVADQPGTYWYHSHDMGQYPDGLRGAMIVHDPLDPYRLLYDEERVLAISDWYNTGSIPLVQAMLNVSNTHFLPPFPDAVIVNDGKSTDYSIVTGKTYRFRIISYAAFASAMIQFDASNNMTVIMNDASYIQPKNAGSLRVAPAQRYDVLVKVTDGSKNHPFLVSLDINRDYTNAASSPAVAWPQNYTGYLVIDPAKSRPTLTVPVWSPVDDSKFLPLKNILALPPPDVTVQLDFNFCTDRFGLPRACFNNAPYIAQKVPTLYSAASTGNFNTNPAVYGGVHPFVVSYGQVVDIVVNNLDAAIHPFHLHGHQFQVMARPASGAGEYPGAVAASLNLLPPSRDTTSVMANSYGVFRFKADNPGVYLFHCHIEWHVEMGLTATIIEAPEKLRNIPIPQDHIDNCKALDIPFQGNAGGDLANPLDTSNYNTDPPQTYVGASYVAPKKMRSRVMRRSLAPG